MFRPCRFLLYTCTVSMINSSKTSLNNLCQPPSEKVMETLIERLHGAKLRNKVILALQIKMQTPTKTKSYNLEPNAQTGVGVRRTWRGWRRPCLMVQKQRLRRRQGWPESRGRGRWTRPISRWREREGKAGS